MQHSRPRENNNTASSLNTYLVCKNLVIRGNIQLQITKYLFFTLSDLWVIKTMFTNLSIGLSRTDVGMHKSQKYISYQVLFPQCSKTSVGSSDTTIRICKMDSHYENKSNAMLCCIRFATPPPTMQLCIYAEKTLLRVRKKSLICSIVL